MVVQKNLGHTLWTTKGDAATQRLYWQSRRCTVGDDRVNRYR